MKIDVVIQKQNRFFWKTGVVDVVVG